MGISVTIETPASRPYHDRLHFWQDPTLAILLGNSWWFVARRGESVVGTWLVPYEQTPAGSVARRTDRIIPYASPWLADGHPGRRRDVWRAMLLTLQEVAVGLELPLAPGFHDYGAVFDVGGFLEARHTHWITGPSWSVLDCRPTVRNHIRVASRASELRMFNHPTGFRFDRAIVGSPQAHVVQRSRFAQSLAERGSVTVLEAYRGKQVLGQLLLVDSNRWRLAMHSWFSRDCGVRGIPSLILGAAIARSMADPQIDLFGLEGSIISRVDQFFDGMGGTVVPYAIAYWYRDTSLLLGRLRLSLEIQERSLH